MKGKRGGGERDGFDALIDGGLTLSNDALDTLSLAPGTKHCGKGGKARGEEKKGGTFTIRLCWIRLLN